MSKLIKGERYSYTNIDNTVFFDNRLSAKAKGVLCQMLSLPDNWDYSVEGLTTRFSDGKASIRSAITELEQYGYLVRRQVKNGGKYAGMDYLIYANPKNSPYTDSPMTEIQTAEIQTAENRTQLNTNKLNTNTSSFHEEDKRGRFKPPTLEEVKSYIEENGYYIDAESFVDFYASKGWMVGKNKMKDWKAAVRTWEKRRNNEVSMGQANTRRTDGKGGRVSGTASRSGSGTQNSGTRFPSVAYGFQEEE